MLTGGIRRYFLLPASITSVLTLGALIRTFRAVRSPRGLAGCSMPIVAIVREWIPCAAFAATLHEDGCLNHIHKLRIGKRNSVDNTS